MQPMAPDEPRSWDDLSSKEKVGRRLKSLRTACQLSQEQVAVALDLSIVKLQRIERGEAVLAFPDELERACDLFSVRFEQFMDPNYAPDPQLLRPFVVLTVGTPSPELAERVKAFIEDANNEHVAKIEKARTKPIGSARPAPPRPRSSRPGKND